MSDAVAVLGAGGMMGFPIARNLVRAGHKVRAWNRSLEKAEPLADDGAEIADTPAQAAEGADVVLTMLADVDAVLDSMDGEHGALSSAGNSMIWAQMSTIGLKGTEACVKLAADREIRFVDCPVLGTVHPAEEGKLVVMASGAEDTRDRLVPVFEAIGQKTMWLGEAGLGTRLKLVTNSWIVAVVEGGAETMALADGLGVKPEFFFDAIEGGALDLPYLRMKGKAIVERNFEPSFRLKLAAKDAALVEEAADTYGLDLPLAHVIRERLEQGAREHGDEDMAATYLTSAPNRNRA